MKNLQSLLSGFLLVFILPISVGAQQNTDFSPTQQKEYNKQKLTLNVWGVGRGSYGGGNISYDYSARWAAYEGFDPISESKFYSLAGYDDLAAQAGKRAKRRKTYGWLTGGLLGAGLVAVFAAPSGDGSFNGGHISGLVMLGGAIGFGLAGLSISGNLKPYGVASSMADDYNLELSLTIKKNF